MSRVRTGRTCCSQTLLSGTVNVCKPFTVLNRLPQKNNNFERFLIEKSMDSVLWSSCYMITFLHTCLPVLNMHTCMSASVNMLTCMPAYVKLAFAHACLCKTCLHACMLTWMFANVKNKSMDSSLCKMDLRECMLKFAHAIAGTRWEPLYSIDPVGGGGEASKDLCTPKNPRTP